MTMESLLALLKEQQEQSKFLQEQSKFHQEQNKLLQAQLQASQVQQEQQLELIKQLSTQLEKLQRMLFGQSSERLKAPKQDEPEKFSVNRKTTTTVDTDNRN